MSVRPAWKDPVPIQSRGALTERPQLKIRGKESFQGEVSQDLSISWKSMRCGLHSLTVSWRFSLFFYNIDLSPAKV